MELSSDARHRHTPAELEEKQLVKYLADFIYFSFEYSQGGEFPQKLLFQYIAADLDERGIVLPVDIWESVIPTAEKQVHARIGKYAHFQEDEGNLYVTPPNHPFTMTEPNSVLHGQFRVMKEAILSPAETLLSKESIITKLTLHLIYRDLTYLAKGRVRNSDSGLDPYQSYIRDYAVAEKTVPGPEMYSRIFTEVGQYLRELAKANGDVFQPLEADDLYERHNNALVYQERKSELRYKLQAAFKSKASFETVTPFEWLSALKTKWEQRHPGVAFWT
ncbi:MAG: hypothetical protein M3Q81_00380 [bacterium]|nr:hypothetical protein [bacterium]